jgi:hypothetical protein
MPHFSAIDEIRAADRTRLRDASACTVSIAGISLYRDDLPEIDIDMIGIGAGYQDVQPAVHDFGKPARNRWLEAVVLMAALEE